jgi:hypothetical protein
MTTENIEETNSTWIDEELIRLISYYQELSEILESDSK